MLFCVVICLLNNPSRCPNYEWIPNLFGSILMSCEYIDFNILNLDEVKLKISKIYQWLKVYKFQNISKPNKGIKFLPNYLQIKGGKWWTFALFVGYG